MRLTSKILTMLALAAAIPAAAQSARVSSTPTELFLNGRPALQFSNPSFLSTLDSASFSSAKLSAVKKDGWLVSLSDSPDLLTGEAGTESYVKLSDRLYFQGRLSYSYSQGQQMGAQVLMNPMFNPVNFLESVDTTRGIKNTETYTVCGKFAYKLTERLSAGFGFDYISSDQTKIKDPRFSNVGMDLSATAGLSYRIGSSLMLGLNVSYRQVLEQVKGGIFGTTDKQYFYATDKGGFFGLTSELDGDNGHISVSSFRPMSNSFFTAALQVSVANRFFSELSVSQRDGYYGKKSYSSPVFYEFGGLQAAYKATLLLGSESSTLHRINAQAGMSKLSNSENVFKYVSPVGEETRVEYTGANKILSRTDIDASADYRLTSGKKSAGGVSRPSIEAGAAVSAFSRTQKTTLYPFYRNSSFQNVSAEVFAFKGIAARKGVITIGGSGLFFTGSGVAKNDGSYIPNATSSLKSYDEYLNKQFEYDTAPRVQAGLDITFTMLITKGIAAYISASDSYCQLLKPAEYLRGASRNCAVITLGCSF